MLLFKFGYLSANFVVFWQLLFWKALTFAITFLYARLQTYYGMAMSVRVSVRLSVTVFRTFLLHALTYWAEILYVAFFLWTFDQVRVSSIFVGVMPLVELRILEIHSFTHFSLTNFDILSWNFPYDFVWLYYRSSSSVVNCVNFCRSYAPFGN